MLRALGLPTGHDYMSFVEADWQGHPGHRLPHRLHRRARLRAGAARGRSPRSCGTPCSRPRRRTADCRAGSAPATRCAPRWATRCTARTSSLDITPVQARVRLGRRLEEGRLLGPGGARRREGRAVPAGCPAGLVATGRGIPRAHCAVRSAAGEDLGEVTSGTFSPTLRQGIALALLAPSVSEGDEVVVDVRGREVPRPGRAAALRGGRCPRGLTGADTGRRRTPRSVGARQ